MGPAESRAAESAPSEFEEAPAPIGTWGYIARNIATTLEQSLRSPHTVVYLRGHRGVGRRTLLYNALKKRGCDYTVVIARSNDDEFRTALIEKLAPHMIGTARARWIVTTRDVIVNHIKCGKWLVLDEIQNTSVNMQVSLQESLDAIAFQSLFNPKDWSQAGSVVIMGSILEVVDSMLDHGKAPLYARHHIKITVFPFDTLELCRMYKQLWGPGIVLDGKTILTLFTLLGRRPCLYQMAANASLLTDHKNIARETLVDILTKGELRSSNDRDDYIRSSLSPKFVAALDVVEMESHKEQQIDRLAEKCNLEKDLAFSYLSRLCSQFGLIDEVRHVKDMTSIYGFRLCDPAMMASRTLQKCAVKHDDRTAANRLDVLEGEVFEDMVRQILRDRRIDRPILPHEDFAFSSNLKAYVLPRVAWDNEVEVDIMASIPGANSLIVGSCIRSSVDDPYRKLAETWAVVLEHLDLYEGVLGRLMLPCELDDIKVYLVHFVAHSNSLPPVQKLGSEYIFTLPSLLQPFYDDV